jgi:hypothetical protein
MILLMMGIYVFDTLCSYAGSTPIIASYAGATVQSKEMEEQQHSDA